MKLQDKVIWITGASSGIGKSLVLAVYNKGANVILSSRWLEDLAEVKEELGLLESRILLLPLDLEKQEQMTKKCQQAIAQWGMVDILVNNGGISQRSLVKDTGLEVDRKMMEVNYMGTICLTKALLPHFLERNAGYYVTVTSLMGKFGAPLRSSYAGAKHALHVFFDSLRAEVYDNNIKVTLVSPGFVQTNISLNALTGDGSPQNTMDEKTAGGITAQHCADLIVKAIEREKTEIYPAKMEKLALYLQRFFPFLLHKVVRTANVR